MTVRRASVLVSVLLFLLFSGWGLSSPNFNECPHSANANANQESKEFKEYEEFKERRQERVGETAN
jgi:hypothetical protein